MGRILKQKRILIEEANRRLLGEQNRKVSDEKIETMRKLGLVGVEVKPGDSIDSIVKNSRQENSINLLDFEHKYNTHITDPNLIYPGDILFFMTDPTGKGFRNAEEVDGYIESLNENGEPLNEVIGLTAAILAYRQTAKGKSKRLTRKIRKALDDKFNTQGGFNKIVQDGNFNKFMRCINSAVTASGEEIKGKKRVSKELVRNADMFTGQKKKAKSADALMEFEEQFDKNIKMCADKFDINSEYVPKIKEVMMEIIKKFQQKSFHI
tara:strand:+ start:995 stop:1792 length:798 start_codon:yes stop_codon:yes gene_type:complete